MGKKTLLAIAAVVAASGALLSAPAQARGAVVLSLGVPAPVYSYGYPVYPQPVYTQPYVLGETLHLNVLLDGTYDAWWHFGVQQFNRQKDRKPTCSYRA